MTTIQATFPATAPSKAKIWTSHIMGGLVIAFMLFDGIFKFIIDETMLKSTPDLGYQLHHLPILGSLALVCTFLYLFPRTQIIGLILLTGYWGGAIAAHVRLDNPLFSHVLFPVYLAILAWGAVWLKNEALRNLILNKK